MVLTLAACNDGEKPSGANSGGIKIPDGATAYACHMGIEEVTVVLHEGKVWFIKTESEEMSPEMMAQNGLTGTLCGVMTIRYELSNAETVNGVLIVSGADVKAYQSIKITGTAAKAYVEKMTKHYKDALDKGQITKDQYAQLIDNLNGKETLVGDSFKNITVKIKLNDQNKTGYVTSAEITNANGMTEKAELEYSDNGKLEKEISYTYNSELEISFGGASVTTYYPDGKTEKMYEAYDLTFKKEDGSLIVAESPKYKQEYREDGSVSKEIHLNGLGEIVSITEYDEGEKAIKETYYTFTENGRVVDYYYTYTYTDTTLLEKRYDSADILIYEIYREKDEDKADADPRWWYIVKYVEYDSEGGKSEKTYYHGAENERNSFKDRVDYDASGNEVYKATYDEAGNVIDEYLGGVLLGGSIDDTLPDSYVETYENFGMIWKRYYSAGVTWKETVTFTNGTTITVIERDSSGRYIIHYGYYTNDDGVITMLEVYDNVYVGNSNNIEAQSWKQYSAPDGALVATSGDDVDEGGNLSDGKPTVEIVERTVDGIEVTEYYVYGNCVKMIVKFENGSSVCVRELDERGREKIFCGYSRNESDRVISITVSEYIYDGDDVKYEKHTDYSAPDGTVTNEYVIKH
jgi:intracellular sulfur oxidation DsrE/DsrF family protein